jgi:hypothetical protein
MWSGRHLLHALRVVPLLACVVCASTWAVGCRTPVAPPTESLLLVSVSPNPVSVNRSARSDDWTALYHVRVFEAAGLGGTIGRVDSEIRAADGTTIARASAARGERVEGHAGETLDLLLSPLPGIAQGPDGVLTVTILFRDDRGHHMTVSATAEVR